MLQNFEIPKIWLTTPPPHKILFFLTEIWVDPPPLYIYILFLPSDYRCGIYKCSMSFLALFGTIITSNIQIFGPAQFGCGCRSGWAPCTLTPEQTDLNLPPNT